MKISKPALSPTQVGAVQIGVGVNLSDTGDCNISPSVKLTPTPEVRAYFDTAVRINSHLPIFCVNLRRRCVLANGDSLK